MDTWLQMAVEAEVEGASTAACPSLAQQLC